MVLKRFSIKLKVLSPDSLQRKYIRVCVMSRLQSECKVRRAKTNRRGCEDAFGQERSVC
jgi:hypothetical protein